MPFYNGLPLFGPHLYSNSRLDLFSVEQKKQLHAEYRHALGIGKDATFSAEAFGVLAKASIRDFHGFKDTKGPGDLNIHKKLVGASLTDDDEKADAKTARDGISEALAPTEAFTNAQTEFEASVATFRRLADQIPTKYKAQDLINHMIEINGDAIKAIKAQHTHEKEALLEKFKDLGFTKPLSKTLKLSDPPNPAEMKIVQDNMIKDLESSQAEKLQAFEKSTAESVSSLQKASAQQMNELLFIANLYKNNNVEREKMIKDAAKNPKNANSNTAVIGMNEEALTISGITIESLGAMTTYTGKTAQPVEGKPGSFFIEMKNPWFLDFDPAYYQDPRQNTKADLLFLAEAVKGSGFEKVTMRLDFDPDKPDIVSERAKEAYEAAVLAGFPHGEDPSKIAIIVNGVEMSPKEIFKDEPGRLSDIHAKGDQKQKELKALLESKEPQSSGSNMKMKEEATKLKAEDKLKQEEAAREAELDNDEEDDASLSNGPSQ